MTKRKWKTRTGLAALNLFFLALCIVTLIPILYALSVSFSGSNSLLSSDFSFIPRDFTLTNYRRVLLGESITTWFRNTVFLAAATVLLSLTAAVPAAYCFSRRRFPGRRMILKCLVLLNSFPAILSMFAIYRLLRPVGLVNTRAGLILIYVATNVCGHTFFLRNFFRSLPSSLAESVLLDGGGHKDIFFRVMLPLSAPAVGTMTIFAFQGFWEEYFTAKVLVGANEKMITFPLLLQRLNGQYATRWEWVFAASIMALIPVIVLFVVFQRKTVVGGLTQGAVKG